VEELVAFAILFRPLSVEALISSQAAWPNCLATSLVRLDRLRDVIPDEQ
jgi:hypothetical protein